MTMSASLSILFAAAAVALPAIAGAAPKMETSSSAPAAPPSERASQPGAAAGAATPAAAEGIPPQVEAALRAAFALPDARMEIVGYRSFLSGDCSPNAAEASGAIEGSGRVAVRVLGADTLGAPCEGWSWAEVQVSARVWITTRPLRQGDPLEGAVRGEIREIGEIGASRRPLLSLADGARASRSLAAGTVLEPSQIAVGLLPGEPVLVNLRSGALSILAEGRGVACGRDRICATLPSGKRVEGHLEGELLVVEAP